MVPHPLRPPWSRQRYANPAVSRICHRTRVVQSAWISLALSPPPPPPARKPRVALSTLLVWSVSWSREIRPHFSGQAHCQHADGPNWLLLSTLRQSHTSKSGSTSARVKLCGTAKSSPGKSFKKKTLPTHRLDHACHGCRSTWLSGPELVKINFMASSNKLDAKWKDEQVKFLERQQQRQADGQPGAASGSVPSYARALVPRKPFPLAAAHAPTRKVLLSCFLWCCDGSRPGPSHPDESSRPRAKPATGMANRKPDPKNKFPGPISRDPMLLFRKADAKNHTDLPRPLNSNDHGHTGQQPTKYTKVVACTPPFPPPLFPCCLSPKGPAR